VLVLERGEILVGEPGVVPGLDGAGADRHAGGLDEILVAVDDRGLGHVPLLARVAELQLTLGMACFIQMSGDVYLPRRLALARLGEQSRVLRQPGDERLQPSMMLAADPDQRVAVAVDCGRRRSGVQ
jgi:hypothetical protein